MVAEEPLTSLSVGPSEATVLQFEFFSVRPGVSTSGYLLFNSKQSALVYMSRPIRAQKLALNSKPYWVALYR